MDVGLIEANINTLRKVIKYVDGDIKIEVEKRIKKNYELIDEFFDGLAEEFQTISSYEQDK